MKIKNIDIKLADKLFGTIAIVEYRKWIFKKIFREYVCVDSSPLRGATWVDCESLDEVDIYSNLNRELSKAALKKSREAILEVMSSIESKINEIKATL